MPSINQAVIDEYADLVLTHLSEIDQMDYVSRVLATSDRVSLANQSFFELSEDFRKSHNRYPDLPFLEAHGFTAASSEPFSWDVADHFLHFVESLQGSFAATEQLAEGDFDAARETLADLRPLEAEDAIEGDFGIDDVLGAYDELTERPAGCLFYVSEIDQLVQGLSYGTLSVLAAPAGGGKTTMLMSSLYGICFVGGYSFVLLSMEMSKKDVWFSLLSRHAKELGYDLPAQQLKKGLLEGGQRDDLATVVADWKANCKGHLRILTPADMMDFSRDSFVRVLRRADSEWAKGVDGVAVDYIQLMRYYTPKGQNMAEFLNNVVSEFSVLSRAYSKQGLISILLSQVNRDGMKRMQRKREADMLMLAELNSLERDAAVVVVAFSDSMMRSSKRIAVQVVKNRTGETMDEMIEVYCDFAQYQVGYLDDNFGVSEASGEAGDGGEIDISTVSVDDLV